MVYHAPIVDVSSDIENLNYNADALETTFYDNYWLNDNDLDFHLKSYLKSLMENHYDLNKFTINNDYVKLNSIDQNKIVYDALKQAVNNEGLQVSRIATYKNLYQWIYDWYGATSIKLSRKDVVKNLRKYIHNYYENDDFLYFAYYESKNTEEEALLAGPGSGSGYNSLFLNFLNNGTNPVMKQIRHKFGV